MRIAGRATRSWLENAELPERWTIAHGELRFELKRTEFGHLGIFPEQSANWDWIAKQARGFGPGMKVLNLFAYTGGCSLAAAAAGAEVVHVDAAKNTVAWARRNAELSGLAAGADSLDRRRRGRVHSPRTEAGELVRRGDPRSAELRARRPGRGLATVALGPAGGDVWAVDGRAATVHATDVPHAGRRTGRTGRRRSRRSLGTSAGLATAARMTLLRGHRRRAA